MREETTPGTITIAIQKAQNGDHDEFSKLVNRHQEDVERLAQYFLGGDRKSNLMLGEDVMQSVFLQLWQGLSDGKTWFVSAITDRDQLFSVLERLTWLRARKAVRHSKQKKRNGTLRDSDVESGSESSMSSTFEDKKSSRPDINFEVKSLIEEASSRLGDSDSQLRVIFEDLLRNVDVAATAEALAISKRGVQRKRKMIKSILENWMEGECRSFAE